MTGTYPYTLNGLLNQYYISTKAIIIFFVDDENFFPPFSKEDKEGPLIFLYIILYLVTNHWKEGYFQKTNYA